MSSGSSTGTWFWAFTVPVSPDAKSRFITKAAAVGHLHGIFGVTNCTTQSWKLLNDTMSSPLSTTRSASAPFQPWTPLAIFGLLHQPSCIAAEQFFFEKKLLGRRLLHHTRSVEIFHWSSFLWLSLEVSIIHVTYVTSLPASFSMFHPPARDTIGSGNHERCWDFHCTTCHH